MTAVLIFVGVLVVAAFLLVMVRVAQRPFLLEVHLREGEEGEPWLPYSPASAAEAGTRRREPQESGRW